MKSARDGEVLACVSHSQDISTKSELSTGRIKLGAGFVQCPVTQSKYSKGSRSDVNNMKQDETRAASTGNLRGKSLLDRPPTPPMRDAVALRPSVAVGGVCVRRKQVSNCAYGAGTHAVAGRQVA